MREEWKIMTFWGILGCFGSGDVGMFRICLWICYGRYFSGKWRLAILYGDYCCLGLECSRKFATECHN